jgi:hypothetical protein
MKKAIVLLAIALISFPAISQGRKYQKGMLKAIEQMNEANEPQAYLECAATFEEFADANPTQWIPPYYSSYMLIITFFEEVDPVAKDKLLERANKSLGYALKMAPKESEIHVLQAFYYIGMMSVDSETSGPEYFEDFNSALNKARELNSNNPRAAFLDGMMALNMPDFMGGGPAAAKPIFLEADKLFNEFQNEDPLWPSWGADLVKDELEKLKDMEISVQ